jgi:phosphatidate cytidylyltransferase
MAECAPRTTRDRLPAAFATSIVFTPILIGMLALDQIRALHSLPLLAVVLTVAMIGGEEAAALLRCRRLSVPLQLGTMSAALPVLLVYCLGRDLPGWLWLAVTAALVVDVLLIALALIAEVTQRQLAGLRDFAAGSLCALVIGGLLSYLLVLRLLDHGAWAVFLAGLAAWTTDTWAYLIGRKWGKRKLIVRISPNKTVVGAVAGLVFCAAVFVIFPVQWWVPQPTMLSRLLIGVGLGMAAQIGDLLESSMKRVCGAKDSGTIIPGHGGVLDRFDSVLLVAPALYYYLIAVIR